MSRLIPLLVTLTVTLISPCYAQVEGIPYQGWEPTAPDLRGGIEHNQGVMDTPYDRQLPDNPPPRASQPPLTGHRQGGQDEYLVDWQAWENQVSAAMRNNLARGWVMGGCHVWFDVTRDGRVTITRRKGIGSGKLADSIMSLQGSSVLQFPAGSQKAVHHAHRGLTGMPIPTPMGGTRRVNGSPERVTRQW